MAGFVKTKGEIKAMAEGNRKELAAALVKQVEFIEAQLRQLQKDLKKEGWVETYQNGKDQSGVKKSSKGETYMQLIKNFVAVVNSLVGLLPENTGGADELQTFLAKYKK